ncbi:MAG: transketolase, partial [Mycobacterium sp.]|nr:transketolase [Mycobacterium sp.]
KADRRPSFIAVRTVIGNGAPGVEGTAKAHGSPLGEELLAETKRLAGWEFPPFTVPGPVRAACANLAEIGAREHTAWREEFAKVEATFPERAAEFRRAHARRLPAGVEDVLQRVTDAAPRATRQTSQACLNAALSLMPELVGGSADLSGSTGTVCGDVVTRDDYSRSAIAFGIREFGMAAIMNGISLHGGFRVFGSTFLVFADYLRPALRLSAIMRQPVIYVFTHDSIAVGEDGPTHQPIAHIESLRIIPGLQVLRPADDAETAKAWLMALEHTDGPTALLLSRQSLPQLDTAALDGGDAVAVEIVATGSEVSLAADVAKALRADGYGVRVISALDRSRYVPDPTATKVSIEAGTTGGWAGLVDLAIGIDEFGASGPGDEVMAHYGFTVDAVLARIRARLDNR